MTITTAAQFWQEAHGRTVIRTTEGVPTLDDWEAIRQSILSQLREQGATDITEDDDGTIYAGNQFWRKPKQYKEEEGRFEVGSKKYRFINENYPQGSFGEKKGAKIVDGCLVKDYGKGYVIKFQIKGK